MTTFTTSTFTISTKQSDGKTILTLADSKAGVIGTLTFGALTSDITLQTQAGSWALSSPEPPAKPLDPNRRHLYVSSTGSDSAAGSQAAPLRTIQAAARKVTPGTTVHVLPGVYAETINGSIDGTSAAPIIYLSETPRAAIVRPSAATSTIWADAGDYVVIRDFEIDGTMSPKVRTGVYLTGSYSTISGCEVHHIYQSGVNDNQGGGGIVLGGGYYKHDNQHAMGNHVHHVGGGGFFQGIYHQSTGSIVFNLIHDIAGMGISLWHDPRDITIDRNTVFKASYGIGFGAGDWYGPQNPADNIKVTNNIVYDCGYGIGDMGSVGKNVRVDHNMSVANKTNYNLQSGTPHTNDVIVDRATAIKGMTGMGV